jgi:hypothetical protein
VNQVMRSFLPLLAVGLFGCSSASVSSPTPAPLTSPLAIAAQGAMAGSRVSVVASGGFAQMPSELVMPLEDLKLRLDSGDHPRLLELEMPLGNIDVPASTLPPQGLKLRNLKLTLVEMSHVEVLHAQEDALELQVTTPIQLDWSMVLDNGKLFPLGPARTQAVPVSIDIVRSNGTMVATVNAQCAGTCWSIDGIGSLSDGALYGEAPAVIESAAQP